MIKGLPLVLLIALVAFCAGTFHADHAGDSPQFSNTLVEPGLSVGPLKLGESRGRAVAVFPKKSEDQEWDDSCGTTLDWVDTSNPIGRGDGDVRVKKEKSSRSKPQLLVFTPQKT